MRPRLTPLFLAAIASLEASHCAPRKEESRVVAPEKRTRAVVPEENPPQPEESEAAVLGQDGGTSLATEDGGTSLAGEVKINGPSCPAAQHASPMPSRGRGSLAYGGPMVDVSQWLKGPTVRPGLPKGFQYVALMERGGRVLELGVRPNRSEFSALLRDFVKFRQVGQPSVLFWIKNDAICSTSHFRFKPGDKLASFAAALAPIDSAAKAVLLLQATATLSWTGANGQPMGVGGAFARAGAKGTWEVLGVAEDVFPGACPHSNMFPGIAIYSVTKEGAIDLVGAATAKDNVLLVPPARGGAPCVGRDTQGSGRVPLPKHDEASYFRSLARDEALSVRSFRRLAGELRCAGAPSRLVSRSRKAAREEAGHAKIMMRLSRAADEGNRVAKKTEPASKKRTPRTGLPRALPHRARRAMLVENAQVGCVQETFAALLATLQAERATEPNVRRAMQKIAKEETRHAELAWDIYQWGLREDPSLHGAMKGAMDAAIEELLVCDPEEAHAPYAVRVGEPDGPTRRKLVASIFEKLRRMA